MEPITHFTDYPSLFPQMITNERMEKEWKEVIDKLVNIKIRESLGGKEAIHKLK